MAAKNKFYVTTPIYYPNDAPHLGHAYTTIAADVLARWHRLLGKDVFFLTGTDEHGKKIEQAAEKAGKKPKTFVDSVVPKFTEAWEKLNIKYDRFIRTTDSDHEQVVSVLLAEAHKRGDIYEGYYEGFYCTACEAYYTEKDLADGCCPVHRTKIEKLKEESYFFKLSKYQKALLDLYKKNPNFISPKSRQQEIINRVKEGLQDLSISRTSFSWGIPLPFDKKHYCYVWFDALVNYISGVGYLESKETFKKFWPADVHIIGKDILWFHTVIWPAILLSVGIEPPKKVFAHGWWTVRNEKMGKSAGNAVNIDQLIGYAGVDSARYFLLREAAFGDDGDFSGQALTERHNSELANKLGNLVSRVSALAETYGIEKAKAIDSKKLVKEVEAHLDNLEFDKALNVIFGFIDKLNEQVQAKKPWETHDKAVLYQLANGIKDAAILLSPFIPETTEKIAKTFHFNLSLDALEQPLEVKPIKKAPVLFKKIEVSKKPASHNNKVNKSPLIPGIMAIVNFKDWEKLDLRVGKIEKVEDIEGADKLYKLTINIGSESKVVVAGIKQFYAASDLEGKSCVIFVNLTPRKMKGLVSEGMILAAVNEDESQVVLIQPDKDIKEGSKVR